MQSYIIQHTPNNLRYLDFTFQFDNQKEFVDVKLPKWRPGRYELGNFAKNIRGFRAYDAEKNQAITFKKIDSHTWRVFASGKNIKINYQYYAATLNAGSTFSDDALLFVNPVNCCMYIDEKINDKIELEIKVKENFKIACSLEKITENKYLALDFHELADSPILSSEELVKKEFFSHGVQFNLWFHGMLSLDEKFIDDVKKYTNTQIEIFGDFPVSSYDYLFIFTNNRAYHGVEHSKGTAIYLGPDTDIFSDRYKDLLGVSSHELFHTWNVKCFRDEKMTPYKYDKENYSELGYIAEGVTTFYGDWTLYRSGVFSKEDFLNELTNLYQKYQNNLGRKYYSVAESSFDTWLDGYELGAPNRKVSIYNEGAIITFIIDVYIRKNSDNKLSMDNVLKELYKNYKLNNKAYNDVIFLNILESISGLDFSEFFENYIYSNKDLTPLFDEALNYHNFEVIKNENIDYIAKYLGVKLTENEGKIQVVSIYPESIAQCIGLNVFDELISINNRKIESINYLNNFIKAVSNSKSELFIHYFSNNCLKKAQVSTIDFNNIYYQDYKVISK